MQQSQIGLVARVRDHWGSLLCVCVCRCCLLDEASFNNFRGLFLFTWLAVSSLLSVVNVVRWPACSASVCSATGRCGRLC